MLGRRNFLQLIGAAAAASAGCARKPIGPDAPIEVLATSEPLTIDPRFTADVYGLRISRLVHATLAAPDVDTLAPHAWLAQTLELDEGGAVIATLHPEACFHDGSRVTARDVVASFRALADPAMHAPARRIVDELSSIDAIDGEGGARIRFVPRRPRAIVRQDLDLPILKADEAWSPRGSRLTGCGPYAIDDATAHAIALSPAATYGRFGGETAHRPVIVRTVRDEAARALRMLAGGADIAPNAFAPALAMALPRHGDAPPGLVATSRRAPTTTYLAFNVTRPPLDAPEVRVALARAIDRRAIADAKLPGAAALADGFLPDVIALAPRGRIGHPYDPEGARSVLQPIGARGFGLSLVVTAQRPRVALARAIAQMIGDAGLPVDVRPYELATLTARLNAGDFDIAVQQGVELIDPEMMRWYFHRSAIPPGGANRGRIVDEKVDDLLDRGLATLDDEQRRAIYGELEAHVRERALVAPLFHEDHVTVVSARAAAFTPSADGRWGALARIM
jgi:peptide/nickel transport system substrate-binding protein